MGRLEKRKWSKGAGLFVVCGLAACSQAAPEAPRTPAAAPGAVAEPRHTGDDHQATEVTPPTSAPRLTRAASRPVAAGRVLAGEVPPRLESGQLRGLRFAAAVSEPAWLALDDHAPRSLAAPGLGLLELLNEDLELSPGHHRLIAVQRGAGGYVVDVREFWLSTEPVPSPQAGCLALSPAGTLNGMASADALELVLVPFGTGFERAQLSFGSAQGAFRVGSGEALVVLPGRVESGDWKFSWQCFDASGRGAAAVDRIVTVNRDLGEKVGP